MAILSKIRERSIALIAIIGLALFAFVLDPSTLSDFFNSSKVNEVGEVNGEAISREEFAAALENYKKQVGDRVSEMQAANTVWDNLVREKIYKTQLEKAGITLGEEDVWAELITQSNVQNNPQFQNEAGLFDEIKFRQYLATTRENDKDLWSQWQNYMNQIKTNISRNTYNDLVSAGLGASLKEGELQYLNDNTKISAQFVYVPYTSIADSLVKVTNDDVANYINARKKEFTVDELRDISYVKFDIEPTFEDEQALKEELVALLEDRKEYSSVTKGEITVEGYKNAQELKQFFDENGSEIALDTTFKFKNQVSKEIVEQVFSANKGDVFGPYKDNGFLKLTKVLEVVNIQDSVKASHILIPYTGSMAANEETTKTEEQAKKTIDSVYNLVKNNTEKFEEIANEINPDGTKGRGGDIGWIRYNTAYSPNFDSDFANYMYDNKKGSIDVVKTKFGYHIIKVDDKKAKKDAVKLATFGRKIVASEETENAVFQKSEKFSLAVSNNNNFFDVAKENNYVAQPAIGLKLLDENIPGLGNQREIVKWSFSTDVNIGDYKRFDIPGGHVVAFVTGKTEKGLMSVAKAMTVVQPKLINEKKAEIIKNKLSGDSLDAQAKSTNTSVKTANGVTFKAPTISGVGFEPQVVGAMSYAKIDKLYSGVKGTRGVFSFVVTQREKPTALPSYEPTRAEISQARKNQTNKLYEAVKEASEIKDYRATYFGVN